MSVVSFFSTFVFATWYIWLLTSTYYTYRERLRLMQRLYAMLDDDKAAKAGLPCVNFEVPENIIVWSKIRVYVLAFKNLQMRISEILLFTLLVGFLVCFGFIIFQTINPFGTVINSDVLDIVSGYVGLFLGIYLCYPVYTALQINNTQGNISKWLAEEQWRLLVRVRVARNADKKPKLEQCYDLTRALAQNIKDVDSTFTILGLAITPTLFGSLVAAILASIASWVSSVMG